MQRVMLVGMALAVIPALLLLALDDDRALGTESEGLLTAAAAARAAEAGPGGGAARGRDRSRSGEGRGRSSSNGGGLKEPLLGDGGEAGERRGGGRGRSGASREGEERRGGGRLSVVSGGRGWWAGAAVVRRDRSEQ